MEPAGESSRKNSTFRKMIEDEIDGAAGNFMAKGTTSDDIAFGRLNVLLSLRRTLDNKTTPEDIGMWGAFNDILHLLRVLDGNETIFSGIAA